ncbi:meiotic recombination protein DMC1/LIM15 homolog [Dermatophagoides farinae]|uniref:Meiotic recombination protein dmc1 n=1 Tax=Dermatophagoides farinae TaxID=6954 RepID=A0A922L4J6_DERFA|nr:meiotic recombination protein DMC1/LIM15 homolog [Dermatophagoides farinae]KAH7646334.1 meiotic recombination protein dmc1/lim15 [Dermatophagoides farinae]KAH9516775.1 Meiotic recombination protein dmc1 [Dermatophagoides farinae]
MSSKQLQKSSQLQTQTQSESEAENWYHDIDQLHDYGISAIDTKKLKAAGICTIKGINMHMKKKLIQIKGLSEAKVDKIKEAAAKICNDLTFMTASQFREKRKMVFKVSTGCEEFDTLLGGGIESMSITEAFGEFRCGKTQLCHTLCTTCQITSDNYRGGKAIYVDTENTFRPNRLKQIAERFKMDVEAALENVLYIRAYTSEQQHEILDGVAAKFHEEIGVYKLLVVDSVMALFRVDYSGRGELADRQQKLGQYLSKLQKIAEEYNVAIFITNQMTADPGSTMSFQADPKKPIGGHIIAHASTVRLSLKKGRGDTRIVKIYDSPDLPENEATFSITDGGISDAKE